MHTSDKYWEKISELFELCQDEPEEKWEKVLKESGEKNPRVRDDVIKLLLNKDKAGIYFNSLKSRIETELSSKTVQHEIKEGDQIDKFTIRKILHRNINSDVCHAERTKAHFIQKIAVKIVKSASAINNLNHKFKKEQKILAGFNHPNIGKFCGEGVTKEGFPYILMEYIDGIPIDQYCEKNRLKLFYRLRVFMQVCDAVQYVHNNCVIHHDIKPGNILVTPNGQVKLIDFGISSIIEDGQHKIYTTKGFAGTISYAPPEQIKGGPPARTSDIYQMGVVLYKLITGEHPSPFIYNRNRKENSTGLIFFTKLINEKYKKKFSLMIRRDFCAILKKAMSENPENRYGDVMALKTDLKNLFNCNSPKGKKRS